MSTTALLSGLVRVAWCVCKPVGGLGWDGRVLTFRWASGFAKGLSRLCGASSVLFSFQPPGPRCIVLACIRACHLSQSEPCTSSAPPTHGTAGLAQRRRSLQEYVLPRVSAGGMDASGCSCKQDIDARRWPAGHAICSVTRLGLQLVAIRCPCHVAMIEVYTAVNAALYAPAEWPFAAGCLPRRGGPSLAAHPDPDRALRSMLAGDGDANTAVVAGVAGARDGLPAHAILQPAARAPLLQTPGCASKSLCRSCQRAATTATF